MQYHAKCLFISVVVLMMVPSITLAHHGFGLLYDVTDQVRIEGVVKTFEFKNPHSAIVLDVVDDKGNTQEWHCEAQARAVLMRKGVTQNHIKPGDKITLEGSRGRHMSNECEVGAWVLADGTSMIMRSKKGRADVAVNTKPAVKPIEERSIFGRWIRVTFNGMPVAKESFAAITEAGKTANAAYSGYRDDPTLACRPANPVRAWSAPGQPTEIRWQDDVIVIQHEFMDHTRIVYMDKESMPDDVEENEMGVSLGRIEGNDLIVDTEHFSAGVLLTHVGESGLTHSSQMHLQERFHVDPESGVLSYQWEAKDPLFYGKPFKGGLELAATDLEIGTFDCVPHEIRTDTIFNFIKINDQVSTSGQPTVEQFQSSRDEGFSVVINLAPEKPENNALPNERELVQSLGMQYYNIPVDWSNPTQEDFDSFSTIMNELKDKKVLIHCVANYRVTAFYSTYAVMNEGWSTQQADELIAQIWDSNPEYSMDEVWTSLIEKNRSSTATD